MMQVDLGFPFTQTVDDFDWRNDRDTYVVCLQLYGKVFDNLRFERIYRSPCCDWISRLKV